MKLSKLKYGLFLLLIFSVVDLWGQQLPLFTQYREYHSFINPATIHHDYYTYEYNLSVGVSYRTQWVNVPGTPQTGFIRGEFIANTRSSVGLVLGAYAIYDRTDPTGFTGFYLRGAGIVTDDPFYGGLSIGLTVGAVQYRVKTASLTARDAGDIIATDNQTVIYPDAGVGIFFYNRIDGGLFDEDTYYVGVSVPQSIGLDIRFQGDNGEFGQKRVQHFYGLLGFYKYLNEDTFLEPSVWVKYAPNAPVHADFNLRFQLSNFMWIGAGYATTSTFHLDVGFLVGENIGLDNQLKIGYGYDWNFNTYGPRFGPSHEINISYAIDTEDYY